MRDDDERLELAFPEIPWRLPIPIKTEEASGFGCRYCIALNGLKGSEVAQLPQNLDEFQKHMKEQHGEKS